MRLFACFWIGGTLALHAGERNVINADFNSSVISAESMFLSSQEGSRCAPDTGYYGNSCLNPESLKKVQKSNTDTIDYQRRENMCYYIGFTGTAIVHTALYTLWYSDYSSSKFHFFNDNHEWLQVDKFGHAYSSYYLGLVGIEAAKWAGIPEHKQWKWALFGSIFQDPIEIWDGISEGWGASAGDLIANTFGTVLSAGQHALWKEQKITMKFSFTPTSYAGARPNVLGDGLHEQVLKDYNGQTYWLCYSPLKKKGWEWLGLAAGYGADGMYGGDDNIFNAGLFGTKYDYSHIKRYRQYYVALDFNLTKIKTSNKTLKTLFFVLNCIKLPSPALEFSNNKLKGHLLMF
jgi:uncharacterized protein YfiM (DUF2279 family)